MSDTWSFIINHLFLPPRLPSTPDQTTTRDHKLCTFVLETAEKYGQSYLEDGSEEQTQWQHIIRMLRDFADFNKTAGFTVHDVIESIGRMLVHGMPMRCFFVPKSEAFIDVILLFIREQNAAVIFRRVNDDTVTYESFEVSPSDLDVMSSTGKLRCSYPGPCISIPFSTFNEEQFRRELANFLTEMNIERLPGADPEPTKVGTRVVDHHNTRHPRYITELLTGILRAVGGPADTKRICKRIAGDVICAPSGGEPWRRSPIWLCIRVALQTTLRSSETQHDKYKHFMLYLLTTTMNDASADCSSDTLHVMRSKIARRALKLENSIPDRLLQFTTQSLEHIKDVMEERWTKIQECHQNPTNRVSWDPSTWDLSKDTNLPLSNSRKAILKAIGRRQQLPLPRPFTPGCVPRHSADRFNGLPNTFAEDIDLTLADFEDSVRNDLEEWLNRETDTNKMTKVLLNSMRTYYHRARDQYRGSPEDLSLMLLVLLELWVALDTLVVQQIPLLGKYWHEIRVDIVKRLLVRKSEDIERVVRVAKYLIRRNESAHYDKSLFAEPEDLEGTFPVRYFDSSPECQALKKRIEKDADDAFAAAKAVYDDANNRYEKLAAEIQRLEHENHFEEEEEIVQTVKKRKKTVVRTVTNTSNCKKCRLEGQAKCVTAKAAEWPLPRNGNAAKTVVFELCCPPVIGRWRDATYLLLHDICTPEEDWKGGGGQCQTKLADYEPLHGYATRSGLSHRIGLASTTLSPLSMGSMVNFPTSIAHVLVEHEFKWKPYESTSRRWAVGPFNKTSLKQSCTFTFADGEQLYKPLEAFLDWTGHSNNEVIAGQSKCPAELSLEEFVAFGLLRSGGKIQWLNILRELRTRNLTFHREQVHILLMQAAWQIGVVSDAGDPQWHQELDDPEFGSRLLEVLDELLRDVSANWAELTSVKTIILLASRLLAADIHEDLVGPAVSLLRQARSIVHSWLEDFKEKLHDCDEEHFKGYQEKICEIAATCRATYDIDRRYLHLVLQDDDDIAVYVECGIILHDNISTIAEDSSQALKRVLDRDRRLAHMLEPLVREQIVASKTGIDQAVHAIWSSYREGSDWEALDSPNERWVTCCTGQGDQTEEPQDVHLDLLSGELLINGKPLGRLPKSITGHHSYLRLFGKVSKCDQRCIFLR
jgi:hypothetical protein